MALSKRKQLIYDYFQQNHTIHPTAEEVYSFIKTLDSKIGIATVYRNLKSMVEEGTLRELNFEKQGVRYDFPKYPHYHFVCDTCGKIENFESETLNHIDDIVEDITKHKVTHKDIIFHGICEECAQKE